MMSIGRGVSGLRHWLLDDGAIKWDCQQQEATELAPARKGRSHVSAYG
jgi:hypothetical protein